MRVVNGFDTDFIPSIADPAFGTDYPGDADDQLLVVETDGGARGYPVSVLDVPHDAYDDVTSVFQREDTFGYLELHGGPEEWNATGPDDLTAKTRVPGVTEDGTAVGFARPRVEDAGGIVRTTVGGTDVVVFADDGELAAYQAPGFEFERTDRGRVRGDGATWEPTTGQSDDGRALTRLSTSWTYASAWQTDHGPASFYRAETTDAKRREVEA